MAIVLKTHFIKKKIDKKNSVFYNWPSVYCFLRYAYIKYNRNTENIMKKYVKYCVATCFIGITLGGLHAEMPQNDLLGNSFVFPLNFADGDKKEETKKDKEKVYIPYVPITMGPWW